jgi:drug/metabolite transporter (DMT)-like permease
MFQRLAVAEIEPLWLITLRAGCGVAFFVPFANRVLAELRRHPTAIKHLLVVGTVNPLTTGVVSGIALQYASSGVVAVLMSLAPLFTALFATVALREPALGRLQLAGLAASFGGVAVLILTRSSGLSGALEGDWRGQSMSIVNAVLMAGATVYARQHLGGVNPLAAACGQLGSGFLVALPIALLIGHRPDLTALSTGAQFSVLFSGAIGLGASFIIFLGLIRRHGPTTASLALYVMPVTAALLGALFLGETITLPVMAGTSLVLAGVFLFTRGR